MKKIIIIIFTLVALYSIFYSLLYDSYKEIYIVPEEFNVKLNKLNKSVYFCQDISKSIKYIQRGYDRYYIRTLNQKDTLITDYYSSVPVNLYCDCEYLILGSGNYSMDDGLFEYIFPIKYNSIDIYDVNNFNIIKSYKIHGQLDNVILNNNKMLLIFYDGTYGIIDVDL